MPLLNKKVQVTVFLIAMLAVAGMIALSYIFMSDSQKLRNPGSDFTVLPGVKELIQNCLEIQANQAITLVGFSDTKIKNMLETDIPLCTRHFDYFKNQGYGIKELPPRAEVVIGEETTFIHLIYVVEVSGMGSKTTYADFYYTLNNKVQLSAPAGIITPGTNIITPDRSAVIIFGEETKATDIGTGEPVKEIRIKLQGKHYLGLENSVVIGNIIYQGLPGGTRFDPPLMMQIKLEEELLIGTNPDTLKLSYFDEDLGIWVAYPESWYDYSTGSVVGKIDHFSLIAVTTCAGEENTVIIPMTEIFKDPFENEGCEPMHWMYNSPKDEEGMIGFHVLPEFMAEFKCTFTNGGKMYVGGAEFDPASCNGESGFIEDWDKDDVKDYKIDITDLANIIDTMTNVQETHLSGLITGTESEKQEKKELVLTYLKTACIEKWSLLAKEKIKEQYKVTDTAISGDGLNDWWNTFPCTSNIDTYKTYEELKTAIDAKSVTIEPNIAGLGTNDNLVTKKKISFGAKLSEVDTMEWYENLAYADQKLSGRRMGAFATPKTFGLSYKKDVAFKDIKGYDTIKSGEHYASLEGIGEYMFLFKDKGNACTDADQTKIIQERLLKEASDVTEANEYKLQINKESVPLVTPVFKDIAADSSIEKKFYELFPDLIYKKEEIKTRWDTSCSDKCMWTINEGEGLIYDDEFKPTATKTDATPGKLRAGSNTVKVRIGDINDACMFANGKLVIVGTGLRLTEDKPPEPPPQANRPETQAECLSQNGFWVDSSGYCDMLGEYDSGYCVMGPGEGPRPYDFPHFAPLSELGLENCPCSAGHECLASSDCKETISTDSKKCLEGKYCCTPKNAQPPVTIYTCKDPNQCVFSDSFDKDCPSKTDTKDTCADKDGKKQSCCKGERTSGEFTCVAPDSCKVVPVDATCTVLEDKTCPKAGETEQKCCKGQTGGGTTPETCGNGKVDADKAETCDTKIVSGQIGYAENCRAEGKFACTYCGDKTVQGNTAEDNYLEKCDGEGCSADCKTATPLPSGAFVARTGSISTDGINMVNMINFCYAANGNKAIAILRACLEENMKNAGESVWTSWQSAITGYSFSDGCGSQGTIGLQCACFLSNFVPLGSGDACHQCADGCPDNQGHKAAYNYPYPADPGVQKGDVLVFGSCPGHIAYVLSVNGNQATLLEANANVDNIPSYSRVVALDSSVRIIRYQSNLNNY
ncbi:MAG: CHAP domain-containing protein [Nanoarchaeota archaeon]|nr:CHAP domain-containing protein [Nanoarchaeota archaeon]